MTVTETSTDTAASTRKDGRVVAIAGPVVDVEFPADAVPAINTALEMTVTVDGDAVAVRAEVAQQIGDARVRAICLKPTDGLVRGMKVTDTGAAITVPVAEWRSDRLPEHLRARLRGVDGHGATLREGEDLPGLEQRLRPRCGAGLAPSARTAKRS